MKHGLTNLCLATLVLLCGCGEDDVAGGKVTADPSPQSLGIAGNWQFSLTSNVFPANPTVTIYGSLAQSGSSLRGAMHVDASPCFDQLTTIELGGTGSGSNLSLTSVPVNGQVIALTASVANNAFTGTYAIDGGCTNRDRGNITGLKVPSVSGTWRIIFDVNEQHVGLGRAMLTQGTAEPEGSFGIGGTTTNSIVGSSCYAGTITAGTFPSPSYIMGSSVNLVIKTVDGGTVSFLGTLNQNGEIAGYYQVAGGVCDGYFGGACLGRSLQSSCHVPL